MITLYGAGPNFGLPEASPFVTKTEVQLVMAGLAYRKERARPIQSPKGQLPFIDDDGERIADSTFIRAHIERKYRVDLDEGLGSRERAEAWAIERMIENHFGFAVAYTRFFVPENFAKGPAHFVDYAPEDQRQKLREELLANVTANFRAAGVLRHKAEEIEWLGIRSLKALSQLLAAKPFLMGEHATAVDAIGFGALAGLLTPYFESSLRRHAMRYVNLVAYVDRMMNAFYPEFDWADAA
ncbi:MAG TPA: glutathione S-transferase family protein [Rhizomicrobium sp.]|nr:glutathione S-transferase family protein [Rhizomicrobium sp.]